MKDPYEHILFHRADTGEAFSLPRNDIQSMQAVDRHTTRISHTIQSFGNNRTPVDTDVRGNIDALRKRVNRE